MSQKRVQILLEKSRYEALQRAACKVDKSVAELIRELVEQYLDDQDGVLQALADLRHLRERQAVYQGDPVVEARAEREAQLSNGIRG